MKDRSGQAGLSLVEVLVAAMILAIALTPALGLLVTSRRSLELARRQSEALALARASMDSVVATANWAEIADEGPSPHPLDPAYTVQVRVRERAPYLKEVAVQVTWAAGGGTAMVTITSAVYRRDGAS